MRSVLIAVLLAGSTVGARGLEPAAAAPWVVAPSFIRAGLDGKLFGPGHSLDRTAARRCVDPGGHGDRSGSVRGEACPGQAAPAAHDHAWLGAYLDRLARTGQGGAPVVSEAIMLDVSAFAAPDASRRAAEASSGSGPSSPVPSALPRFETTRRPAGEGTGRFFFWAGDRRRGGPDDVRGWPAGLPR